MAAQRAAGEALVGTLNEQLKPSALLSGLSAAKAALDAVIQTTSNAAAMISIVSLMVRSFQITRRWIWQILFYHQSRSARREQIRPGPCIKTMHALHNRDPRRVSIPA